MLAQLLLSSLILAEDWETLPTAARAKLLEHVDVRPLLSSLQEQGLLTEYQAAHVEAVTTHGLVLGNYRVIDHIGAGAMGNVFKAEHMRMRRPVAVKVLPLVAGKHQTLHAFHTDRGPS